MKTFIITLCLRPAWMQLTQAQKKDTVKIEYSEEDYSESKRNKNSDSWVWSDRFPGNLNFSWHSDTYCFEFPEKDIHITIPDFDMEIPDMDFYFDWNCQKDFHDFKKKFHKQRKHFRKKFK